MKFLVSTVAIVLLGQSACAVAQVANVQYAESSRVPSTPVAVQRILVAQPFTVTTPFQFTWIKNGPMISSGTLVVLEVDKALVVPRNALEPVLYAGNSPVMRLNHGHLSGRVLGIVPATVDVTTAPLWFGAPELPERVTPQMVESELAKARSAGIAPPPATQLRAARRAPATAKDLASLLRTVGANLILEFAPQERSQAEIWRLPVAKPPPTKRAD
jgi:hypothetical protein